MIKACLIIGHVAEKFKSKVPFEHKICFTIALTGDKEQDDEKILNALDALKAVDVKNIFDKYTNTVIEIADKEFEELLNGQEIRPIMRNY